MTLDVCLHKKPVVNKIPLKTSMLFQEKISPIEPGKK